ncbi:hypothetical protein CFIO01_12371 [Colletotrichum fioriniae PJ7]|uniref:Uncharacterized protein n=1 Tax=Colletotrichum fioriniae PJ7 TaxID=1445577 RepID=A0A010RC16_9PEZI|nr:hypothetical protein CFIO01_12371 [Colletotrichum fioriniae PJ7]
MEATTAAPSLEGTEPHCIFAVKCVCAAGGRTLPWWSAVPDSVFQAVEGTSTFFALVIIAAFGLDSGRVGKGG